MIIYSLFVSGSDLFVLTILSSLLILILSLLLGNTVFDGAINPNTSNKLLFIGFFVMAAQNLEATALFFVISILLKKMVGRDINKHYFSLIILYIVSIQLSIYLLANSDKDGVYLLIVSTLYLLIFIIKDDEWSYWLSGVLLSSTFLFPLTFFLFVIILILWFISIFKITDIDNENPMNSVLKNLYKIAIEPKELAWRTKNKIRIEWKLAYALLSSILSVFFATIIHLLIFTEFWAALWGTIIQTLFALIGFLIIKIKYHEREEKKPTETDYVDIFLQEISYIDDNY